MPRTTRLELHLAAPQKLTHTIGVGVFDAVSFAQELVGLPDRGDLPLLHGLLQIFEGFVRDQLLAPTLAHPALQKLLQTTLPVGSEPPLALAPTVAQRSGGFSPRFEQEPAFRSLSILTRWKR